MTNGFVMFRVVFLPTLSLLGSIRVVRWGSWAGLCCILLHGFGKMLAGFQC